MLEQALEKWRILIYYQSLYRSDDVYRKMRAVWIFFCTEIHNGLISLFPHRCKDIFDNIDQKRSRFSPFSFNVCITSTGITQASLIRAVTGHAMVAGIISSMGNLCVYFSNDSNQWRNTQEEFLLRMCSGILFGSRYERVIFHSGELVRQLSVSQM